MQHPPSIRPNAFRTLALSLAVAAAILFPARAGVVELEQTIPVKYGWNAVYVEVAPDGDLSEIFADWPTDSVGLYDPASFLATRQYSATSEMQAGIAIAPIAMWHRDNPAASEALSMPANTVCIFFSTNANPAALTVRGVPAAPRTTWHVTGPKKPYNFFGLSLQSGASVTPGDYLDGFSGIKSLSGIYRVTGTNAAVPPLATRVYSTTKLADATVLLVPSSEISDWSGPFHVSPMDGLDYGTNATLKTLSVRNDGTQARTASVDLVPSVSAAGTRDLLPAKLTSQEKFFDILEPNYMSYYSSRSNEILFNNELKWILPMMKHNFIWENATFEKVNFLLNKILNNTPLTKDENKYIISSISKNPNLIKQINFFS